MPGLSDSHPRHPWYKERLCKKYLNDSARKANLSGALNSRQWTFLPKGVDDFRDGYPSFSECTLIPSSKGPAPVLHSTNYESDPTKNKPIKRFTKEQACFSKLLPLQQARREYIAQIEYGLTQHPLALYPHLEEGLPPKLFEEIVDILDPEMRLKSASGSYKAEDEEPEEEHSTPQKEQQEVLSVKSREASSRHSAISEQSRQSRQKNPYTWLSKKEESEKNEKKVKINRSLTPAVDENVKQVTKEFCDWMSSLGGEQCNVTESTISSLFASGYDTKPALSVPIHVVELNNVPAELRMSAGLASQQNTLKSSQSTHFKLQHQSHESTYCPSWVKSRYGAWYLDPKTWKKMKINEPLKDPKAEEVDQNTDSKAWLSQEDEDLSQLHGALAFNEFIEKKGYRKPEFLMRIFPKNDAGGSENVVTRESRTGSSTRNTWHRSSSASTHEDSIIN
ncbi:protein FAM47E [Spea bombifrons]|uniref:protein FAM47E n=1 Tax=Spea bombifrons TaxID=233779 RepID=UPI002349CC04|nr:protein FAM47E [Spea bombifrons]